jgi:hypothetical protein
MVVIDRGDRFRRPAMILHWDQLVLHYGAELAAHRPQFEKAWQATYGLLACRWFPADDRLAQSHGDHAEARLLASAHWRTHLPAALAAWEARNDPIVTCLVLNRSPCPSCAASLADALDELHRQFPAACERGRFVLACLGAYSPADVAAATRITDLVRLREAGWEVCALQVGAALTRRGEELREALEHLGCRGFVRLG